MAPENFDPFVFLWSMCNALHRDRLPDRRVVTRLGLYRPSRREHYWLLIERGDAEICKPSPGLDEDLYITTEAEAFVKWHAGQLTWPKRVAKAASTTWNARSMFVSLSPVSRAASIRAD